MKKITSVLSAILTAGMMLSGTALSVSATNLNTADAERAELRERLALSAELLNCDVDALVSSVGTIYEPTKYVAYVVAKSNYSSGSVSMQMVYDSSKLDYNGTVAGSNGLITSTSLTTLGGTWKNCAGTAQLVAHTASNANSIVFRQNYDAISPYESDVKSDQSNPHITHFAPTIYAATVNGVTVTSNYENYFDYGTIALGDVNYDGKLDHLDPYLLSFAITGSISLSGVELAAADVDQDGVIDVKDLQDLYELF